MSHQTQGFPSQCQRFKSVIPFFVVFVRLLGRFEVAWFDRPLSAVQQTLAKLAHPCVFAFTFPFDPWGSFHHPGCFLLDSSCRCFFLWGQQIPWSSFFWTTHHFYANTMVDNTFVSHFSMCNQKNYMPCTSGTATMFPLTQHSLSMSEYPRALDG